jgi:hypothetical protein
MSLVVSSASVPAALTSAVRSEVQALDRDLPIHDVKTMETVITESIADRRLNMLLLGIFAAVALICQIGSRVIVYDSQSRDRTAGVGQPWMC